MRGAEGDEAISWQGGALRRQNIVSRHDYEVPVGRCIDWLADVFKIDQRELSYRAG
jgi:hypothetical protein